MSIDLKLDPIYRFCPPPSLFVRMYSHIQLFKSTQSDIQSAELFQKIQK